MPQVLLPLICCRLLSPSSINPCPGKVVRLSRLTHNSYRDFVVCSFSAIPSYELPGLGGSPNKAFRECAEFLPGFYRVRAGKTGTSLFAPLT